MRHTLDRYASFLTSQLHRLKEEAKVKKIKAPFVTISRQTGAGGISLGHALVHALKGTHEQESSWLLLDRDLVKTILSSKGMPDSYLEYMEEKKISELKDVFETLLNLHPPAFTLVKEVSEAIIHLAEMGHVIIVGRGANILTRSVKNGIHVRLVGSLESRVKRVMKYYEIPEAQAFEKIYEEDQGRKDYLKQNFNKDVDDELLYDLVINTDSMSIDDATKLVVHAIDLKNKEVYNV